MEINETVETAVKVVKGTETAIKVLKKIGTDVVMVVEVFAIGAAFTGGLAAGSRIVKKMFEDKNGKSVMEKVDKKAGDIVEEAIKQ